MSTLRPAPPQQVPRGNPFEPFLQPASASGLRFRAYRLLFHHETPAERWFDIGLIVAIVLSVVIAIVDSMAEVHARHARLLLAIEFGFTFVFTIEYLVRLWCLERPWRYARSFFGLVDLISLLPMYLTLVFTSAHFLIVVRVLRVLRIFRVLQMARYQDDAAFLIGALLRARRKILLFVSTVVTLATVFGALMYLIEGPGNGFTSIPRSIYWAIVTMATVGFGDITPQTGLGQFVTSVIIIIGYGIIAVPTGIYASELTAARRAAETSSACARCGEDEHWPNARYCQRCGDRLARPSAPSEDR
jgi:voltage-gated potassium channel